MLDKKPLFGKWARDRAHERKGIQPNAAAALLLFCLHFTFLFKSKY